MPTISVITPIFNQAVYLPRCVDSVRHQLQLGDEQLIFDDGSKEPIPDANLRSEYRCGVSHARNRLVEMARGDWIKFLDADDWMHPEGLELVRRLRDHQLRGKQVVVGSMTKVVDGKEVGTFPPPSDISRVIGTKNPFLPSMAFVRREALLEVGMFDERIEFEEDWDLWLRLHERYGPHCFGSFDYPVCYYWISQEERKTKHQSSKMVDGMNVREYFRHRYGINPQ